MIISDECKFVFVHIPKCAGTFVRNQLEPIDSYDGKFYGVKKYSECREFDYSHIPMNILSEYFPEEFRKVAEYASVALMRDPRERFVSSLMQHLKLYRGLSSSDHTARRLRAEADRVVDHLTNNPDDSSPKFAHLAKQSSFTSLGGRQVVRHLFRMDQMEAFAGFISEHTGIAFDATARPENANLMPRSHFLRATARVFKRLYAQIPAGRPRHLAYKALRRTGLYKSGVEMFAEELYRDGNIRRFVEDYFAEDFELYESLETRSSAA